MVWSSRSRTIAVSWYEDGRKRSEAEYYDGKRNGRHHAWCHNGAEMPAWPYIDDWAEPTFECPVGISLR